ncbi:MAG: diguanylate cyclase [Pseudomonadota bacterium]
MTLVEPDELVTLGVFVGAQVLVVCLSMVIANAYRERSLLLHATATLLGVLAVQALAGGHPLLPEAVLLLVLGAAGLQLRELVSHAGALRQPRLWLLVISLGLLPVLAAGTALGPWLLLPGVAAWVAVVLVVLLRAWPQSRPWVWWLVPGFGALVAAGAALSWRAVRAPTNVTLLVAGLLTLWSTCVFLGTVWRSRIFGETRVRIDARNTVDPLTGLSTPIVLAERARAARNLIKRYGHPSVLMLVHIENLGRIAGEFGPEAGENAVLTAANRIREALREGDVAARVTHSRVAVLAEGLSPAEAAANVASRILVAGLKEPVPGLPDFLQFRIVLAPVPPEEVPAKALLHRLGQRLEQELQAPSERRIVSLAEHDVAS